MSEQLVTTNDLAQALSRALLDVSAGREVKKSKLQKLIDTSDAINRRLQVQINGVKTMIEAKKHGVDFAASMKELRALAKQADEDMAQLSALATQGDE